MMFIPFFQIHKTVRQIKHFLMNITFRKFDFDIGGSVIKAKRS